MSPLTANAATQADTETVQLLMEAAYTAVGAGLTERANAVFAGLRALRPESEIPVIGQAVALMNSGSLVDATRVLEDEALVINPNSAMARAFLGLTLHLQGLGAQSRMALETVISEDTDPAATALAQSILSGNI
ncbi:MAG: HrpB1 family type III secretion system apparatus protein [Candidatus Methylacidiphilales bacterium]|nr:HrpB1 family type III secretion system apparatus protein [Candidatus Methylacidiphilales bacterium]